MIRITLNFSQIASRFSHSLPIEPKIVMKIHMDKEKSLKHRLVLSEADETGKDLVVQTDANSLLQIIDQLETAKTATSGRKVTNNS